MNLWNYSCWGKGEGEGILGEFKMHMYILLHLKWITRKDLLYSTYGTLDERQVWGRMDICTCMAEFLCCSLETIITLLIGYTPVKKLKVSLNEKKEKIIAFTITLKRIKYLRKLTEMLSMTLLCDSVTSLWHCPGCSDGKESSHNAGDLGSIPGLGRSPGWGHGNPLQYSCLENPHGQRSLVGCSPWGRKESDMTEWLSTATEVQDLYLKITYTTLLKGIKENLNKWKGI